MKETQRKQLVFVFTVIAVSLVLVPFKHAQGQEISVTASVNRGTIGVDDDLILSVKVESSNLKGVGNPELPALEDFAILNTSTSQSHSFSFGLGGKSVSSNVKTYEYTLAPQKEGNLVIAPVKVSHKGKIYETSPINIQVVAGSVVGGGSRRTTPQAASPRDANLDPKDVKENLFLSSWPDKKKVYVGEQITLDQTIFTRLPIIDINLKKSPTYEGFWAEDIFNARHIEYTRKTINNVVYNAAVLKRVALFPVAPGKRTIEPMELAVGVQVDSRDFFGFFGRKEMVNVSGKPIEIEVMPLPSEGKPPSFKGAVGEFSIKANLDKDQLPANDALSVKVEISGTGNIFSVEEPNINLPADFEKYETQTSESQSKKGTKIAGKKTFEYIVVPRVAGNYTIPPIEFAYFDPAKKTYRTQKTEPLDIEVLPGAGGDEPGVKVVSRGEVINVGEDINYIKPATENLTIYSVTKQNLWKRFYWFPLELLAILIAVIYKQRKVRMIEDEVYARNLKALPTAKQMIKQAIRIHNQNPGEALALLNNAIMGYIADRLNLPPAGIIFRDIIQKLRKRGVEEELYIRIENLIDTCNLARYAPGQANLEFNKLIKDTSEILKKLDKKLR